MEHVELIHHDSHFLLNVDKSNISHNLNNTMILEKYLFFGEFSCPFSDIYISFLADNIGISSTNTLEKRNPQGERKVPTKAPSDCSI